ncbi:MAG: PIG-L family deacetylase [Pirellulaceae bacterium]|nr:PIG-L family deacetylase [Pirellulaceae bacterium]
MLFIDPANAEIPKSIPAELVDSNDPTRARLDVIFVGAHPDDVEIACGGTIHSLVEQGYRVGIVDLTDGEPTPLSESPVHRWKEAEAAAMVLGVHYRRLLNLPNRRLMDGFDERVALAKEFRFWRPSTVIGFGNKTPMASPDHYQAMQITDAAVFYSRLTKWDEHFDGLPTHTIARQLYFRLSFEPAPSAGYESQFTVDISKSLDKKIESIACYRSQFSAAKAYVFDRVRGLAVAAGAAAGFDAGENFASPKPLGVKNLLKFFDA